MNNIDNETSQTATIASSTWEIASKLTLYQNKSEDVDTNNGRYERLLEESQLELAKLLSMPNLWPFSWRRGRNELMEIIKREVGTELCDVLSQIPKGTFPCVTLTCLSIELKQRRFSLLGQSDLTLCLKDQPEQKVVLNTPFDVEKEDDDDKLLIEVKHDTKSIGLTLVDLSGSTAIENDYPIKDDAGEVKGHVKIRKEASSMESTVTMKDKVCEKIQTYFFSLYELKDQYLNGSYASTDTSWGIYIVPKTDIDESMNLTAYVYGPHEEESRQVQRDQPLFIPLPLPYGLTNQRIKITSSEKRPTKFENLKENFKILTLRNDDKEVELFDAAINKISFTEGLTVQGLHLSLKVRPFLDNHQAKMIHLLDDIRPIFRPFFSDNQWFVAKTNAQLIKFAYCNRSSEDILLQRLIELSDAHCLGDLDQDALDIFYENALSSIVNFKVTPSMNLSYYQNLVKILNAVPWRKFPDDLSMGLRQRIGNEISTEEAGKALEMLNEYETCLVVISENFGAFALNHFCPLFCLAIFHNYLPKIENLSKCDESMEGSSLMEVSFQIYTVLKRISSYGEIDMKSFQNTFRPCLKPWARTAANKAQKWVDNLLDQKREIHRNHNPTLELNADGSFVECEKDRENWKNSAKDFNGIMHTCFITWTQLECMNIEQNLEYGSTLMDLLNIVFKNFVQGMDEIILLDGTFTHVELTLVLKSLFLAAQYEKEFEAHYENMRLKVGADSHKSKIIANVEEEARNLINRFCLKQRPKIKYFIQSKRFYNADESGNVKALVAEDSEEERNTLLGYLNILLKYFATELFIENEDSEVSQNYKNEIKNMLFDVMEEEMLEYAQGREYLPQIYQALDLANEFRRALSLEDSPGLKNAQRKHWCNKASNSELILEFLKTLDFSECESRGKLNLSLFKNSKEQSWKVTLHSAEKLKPRLCKKELDFSLTLKVLPEGTQRFATQIYYNYTDVLFDMEDEHGKVGEHVFDIVGSEDNLLQIVVYDHSRTGTNKIFRAICILPLASMSGSVELKSYPVPNSPSWTELCDRAGAKPLGLVPKFVRNVKIMSDERRTPTIDLRRGSTGLNCFKK